MVLVFVLAGAAIGTYLYKKRQESADHKEVTEGFANPGSVVGILFGVILLVSIIVFAVQAMTGEEASNVAATNVRSNTASNASSVTYNSGSNRGLVGGLRRRR